MRIHTQHSLIYACTLLGAAPPTRRTLSVAEKAHNGIIVSLRCLFFSLCVRSEWAFKARLNIIILLHKSTAACATSLNMLYAARTRRERNARWDNTKRNNSRRVIFNEPDQIINQLALSSERRGINEYKMLHTLESDFIALCYVRQAKHIKHNWVNLKEMRDYTKWNAMNNNEVVQLQRKIPKANLYKNRKVCLNLHFLGK